MKPAFLSLLVALTLTGSAHAQFTFKTAEGKTITNK
jgi:hypothetical protein